MKRAERALTEYVVGEIVFAGASTVDRYSFDEFKMICLRLWNIATGTSIPVLDTIVQVLKREMKKDGVSSEEVNAWLLRFFHPTNIMRYRSVYEVKYALRDETIARVKGLMSKLHVPSPR